MFQPDEELGDALHGIKGEKREDLLWAASIFWSCMCSTQKPSLENTVKVLWALPSSSCLSPPYSASESSCITQAWQGSQKRPKWACLLPVKRKTDVSLSLMDWTLPWPGWMLPAASHGIKQFTAPLYNSAVFCGRSELEACLPDNLSAMQPD